MNSQDLRQQLMELVRGEGFTLVRFAGVGVAEAARDEALAALAGERLADMAWMTEDWLKRATDPQAFLAGARTLIVVGLPYHSGEVESDDGGITRGRVARYARGRDYHRLFESKLRRVVKVLRMQMGAEARATVDYGPLLERPYATLAGMGWLGKSTMLLAPGFGPWVLLGVIATSLEIEPDIPVRKTCGSCTRCIVACPTGAIDAAGNVLDSRLCISYHTIENRGPIPRELRASLGDWVFGCDECLDACPVGAARYDAQPELVPGSVEDARPALSELLRLDEEAFSARFRGRAIMRAKRDGLVRNACVALGNVGHPRDVAHLAAALDDRSALVRGHAAWGLRRLADRFPAVAREARAALEARGRVESDASVREELDSALAGLGIIDAMPL